MAISQDNRVAWGANLRVSDVSSNVSHSSFDKGITKNCYHGYYDADVWFGKVLVAPGFVHLPRVLRSSQ